MPNILFVHGILVQPSYFNTNDVWSVAAKNAYSISSGGNPLHYLRWISRYIELFREIYETKLFPNAHNVTVETLGNSGHYYYSEEDSMRITEAFTAFLAQFT